MKLSQKILAAMPDAMAVDQSLFTETYAQKHRWQDMRAVFRKHEFTGHDIYFLAHEAKHNDMWDFPLKESDYPTHNAYIMAHIKRSNAYNTMRDTAQHLVRETVLSWQTVPALPNMED